MTKTENEDFLSSESFAKLLKLKGSLSWKEFVDNLQAQKLKDRKLNQEAFRSYGYVVERRKKVLEERNLTKDKICKFCFEKNYGDPQVLENSDFAQLIFDERQPLLEALGINLQTLYQRFEQHKIPASAAYCPRCISYDNLFQFEEIYRKIIPEANKLDMLGEIRQHRANGLLPQ